MRPKRSDNVEARLVVLPFPSPAGDLTWVHCVNCREAIELHQPDAQLPDRLLGICKSCSSWFSVELATERSEVILVLIPEMRSLGGQSQGKRD